MKNGDVKQEKEEKKTPTPTFAILMCVNIKNRDIEQAISSILNQSMSDFLFYIIANNCNDDLWEYLKIIDDKRIILHRTKIGQLAFNLNYGINLIEADYVVRMDSDDISHSNRLEITKKIILENNYPDIVAGSATIINEKGEIIGKEIIQEKNNLNLLWYKSPFIHPATTIKKSSLISIGGYLGGFQSEDYDLWLRMSRAGNITIVTTKNIFIDYRLSITQSRGHVIAYSEVASHLLREALIKNSFKYLIGSFISIAKRYIRVSKHG